jgi:hypothetical protein
MCDELVDNIGYGAERRAESGPSFGPGRRFLFAKFFVTGSVGGGAGGRGV